MSEQPPQDPDQPSRPADGGDPARSDSPAELTGSDQDGSGRGSRISRWFPQGAILFFALAVLVAVVVALIRTGVFDDEDGDDGGEHTSGTRYAKTLRSLGYADGIALSDDNSTSASFTVPIPRDSGIEDAGLRLRGRSETPSSGTIFLTVLIDGRTEEVAELPRGRHDLDLDVDLPQEAIASGQARVQVRLTGALDQQRCNLDDSLGALVSLSPTGTVLRADLDEELHTVRDQVTALEHDVTLDLAIPEGADGRAWFETAAQLGAALTQAGHEVHLAEADGDLSEATGSRILLGPADALSDRGWEADNGDGDGDGDGDSGVQVGQVGDADRLAVVSPSPAVVPTFLTTDAVTTADAASSTPRALAPQRLGGRRVTLESLGATTDVQTLTTSRTWRVPYSIADLPAGSVPIAAQLVFEVPPASADTRWLVQSELNGGLVSSQTLRGSGRQVVGVPLPAGRTELRNDLRVTLLRDRTVGGCHVRQTTYEVQLLPESTLVLGGVGAGFSGVPALFGDGFDVQVASEVLGSPADALAALVPTLAEFSGWEQTPTYVWDTEPGQRPFLRLGTPPAGSQALVEVEGGRITGPGFDLQSVADGLVVQRVATAAAAGLVVTPVGDTADAEVPAYARESARVVATRGGGFVVDDAGQVVTIPPARAEDSP